jgi:prepilin-type N-terminal cleavage/methylation domain-containing protein
MQAISVDFREDNMNKTCNIRRSRAGFSLAEVLAALTIGAMVLVAVLAIYGRAETVAAAITRKLDSSQLPSEILQRIAEDMDRIVDGDSDTKVTVNNKFEKGYQTSELKIVRAFSSEKDKLETFEVIIWEARYDYENEANGLVLYRSHSGIGLEDKLLDEQRASWEKAYPFVPICDGVTFFKILIPRGPYVLDKWTRNSLPYGITAVISFAEPIETLDGTLEVPDEGKISRTIAVGRTRKIGFKFVKKEPGGEEVAEEGEEVGEGSEEIAEEDEEVTEEGEEVSKDAEEVEEDKEKQDNNERRPKEL